MLQSLCSSVLLSTSNMIGTTITEAPLVTTLVAAPTSKLGFLDLPPEIRLQIYNQLFLSPKLSCELPHRDDHPNWATCKYTICTCNFPRHLTSTCRQIRHEALPLLIANTTVELATCFTRFQSLMHTTYLSQLQHAIVLKPKEFSMVPFDPAKLPALKTLELRNITVWCKFYDEYFLESPLADAPMMGMAEFNLNRISPALVALCRMVRSFKIFLTCHYVVNSLQDETVVSLTLDSVVLYSHSPDQQPS